MSTGSVLRPRTQSIDVSKTTSTSSTTPAPTTGKNVCDRLIQWCVDVHENSKATIYITASTLLVLLCLSNSLTRAFKSVWADVGNNWEFAWSYIDALNLSPAFLYIIGSSILHLCIFWPFCLILMYIDTLEHNPLSRFKIQPGKNMPVDKTRLKQAIKTALFNQFCVAFPLNVITYPLAAWRGIRMTLPLPTFNEFVVDVCIFLIVEELLFYYFHRALHHPKLYGRFHKYHHEWTAPIGIAAIYATPLEHICSNILPVLTGPLIAGSHVGIIWVWQSVAMMTAISTHSGYHIPFQPSPEAHDFHHLRFNVNFGVLGILDYLHGTDVMFRESIQYIRHKTYYSAEEVLTELQVTNSKIYGTNSMNEYGIDESIDVSKAKDEKKASPAVLRKLSKDELVDEVQKKHE